MSDNINEVRERLTEMANDYLPPATGWNRARDDLRAILADHARLQEIVNARVLYSNDEGDSWCESPEDAEFVHGLAVGDEYELLVGLSTVRRKFRVTKAPDDTSDDYEVEEVQP